MNVSIDMNEIFYIQMGSSSWLQDFLYLCVYIPYEIVCVILNLLTFLMLQSEKTRKTTLNEYIKIHAFISNLVCMMLLLKGIVTMPRYFSFSYSHLARIYLCHFYVFATCTLIFVANALNVIIIIERLSMFVVKFKKFHSERPYRNTMILLFVLSVLINLILCFQQETKNGADFNMNRNNLTLLL